MTEFLSFLLDISVLVFAVASMLSVGFSYTVQEILGPLRNAGGVIRVLIANFVLVPLLAYFVLQVISLDQPLAIGLFLISSAAGAPFLIKLTATAGQNVAISATLLVLLVPATILYMPIVVPLALPNTEVSAFTIAMPLVLSMLLPLAAGHTEYGGHLITGGSGHTAPDCVFNAKRCREANYKPAGGLIKTKISDLSCRRGHFEYERIKKETGKHR